MDQKKKVKIGVLIGFIVAIVIFAGVSLVMILNRKVELNDEYFKTDGSKIVINYKPDFVLYEDGKYEPEKVYGVYYRSGNNISGVKIFYEYNNAETAEQEYNSDDVENSEWVEKRELDGKYIVLSLKKTSSEDTNAEQITEYAEDLREAGITAD